MAKLTVLTTIIRQQGGALYMDIRLGWCYLICIAFHMSCFIFPVGSKQLFPVSLPLSEAATTAFVYLIKAE